MRDSLRHFTAEFIGTFALVFIGGAAIMQTKNPGVGVGLLEVALAHAFALAIGVSATMRVSGHLNPAVTLGFLVTRRIEPMMAGLYILAQLFGAVIAAYALRAFFPEMLFNMTHGGSQSLAIDVTFGQGVALEAIATFFLVFVVFGTAVDPAAPKIGGLAIGLTIGADILAIGPLTGASMNPARSFGPAVASNFFEGHLVYWIGPIIGGIAAALLYDWLFLPRGVEPVDHGAVRPKSAPKVTG
jgi:MIP family channel proteins